MIDFYIDTEGVLHRADGTKTLASAEERAMWQLVGWTQLVASKPMGRVAVAADPQWQRMLAETRADREELIRQLQEEEGAFGGIARSTHPSWKE